MEHLPRKLTRIHLETILPDPSEGVWGPVIEELGVGPYCSFKRDAVIFPHPVAHPVGARRSRTHFQCVLTVLSTHPAPLSLGS